MSYKNKVYVSFDADNDINYYYLMKAWKQNDNMDFNFYDAHEIRTCRTSNEASIKSALEERFRNTKMFVLLVGEHTKYLYKYVRWEIEQAIKRDIPIIVVNINQKRFIDKDRCPALLHNHLAVHISFNAKILEHALSNWEWNYPILKKEGKSGPYYYNNSVYEDLGL